MREYKVTLKKNEKDKDNLSFVCKANGLDHAIDKSMNMYPNAKIISVSYNSNFCAIRGAINSTKTSQCFN